MVRQQFTTHIDDNKKKSGTIKIKMSFRKDTFFDEMEESTISETMSFQSSQLSEGDNFNYTDLADLKMLLGESIQQSNDLSS